MAQFQPSPYSAGEGTDAYGWNPLTAAYESAKGAVATVTSWVADDVMVAQARQRVNIGSDIYTQLEPRMTKTPTSLPEAQEQSAYFVALASRRAGALGLTGAQDYLLNQLQFVLNEAESTDQDETWACSTTGFGCPIAGGASTLAKAAKSIESANLPQEETLRMTTILYKSRRGALLRQAVPWIIGIGSVSAIGYYFYSKQRT